MRRLALLIGPGFQELPGVKRDMMAWHAFLASPHGGAWNDTEIMDTSELIPNGQLTWNNLAPIVQNAFEADYIFIAFSGHGGTYQTTTDQYGFPETYVYLNDRECISERQFFPRAYGKRCTILLDCCRTPDMNIPMLKTASQVKASTRPYSAALAKKRFCEELEQCEYGIVHIYSTKPGEAAVDVSSFTRCLITGTKYALSQSRETKILSWKDAVSIGSAVLNQLGETQQPVYNAGRRLHHFPFAVNI